MSTFKDDTTGLGYDETILEHKQIIAIFFYHFKCFFFKFVKEAQKWYCFFSIISKIFRKKCFKNNHFDEYVLAFHMFYSLLRLLFIDVVVFFEQQNQKRKLLYSKMRRTFFS